MVYDWSPDPPDVDDRLSYPPQAVIPESDESEDEMPVNAPPGYEFVSLELLSQALGSSTDEDSDSETDTADGVVVSLSTNPAIDTPSSSDPEAGRGIIEDDDIDDEPRDTSMRPDLTADCDQAQRGSEVEGNLASGTSLRPDVAAECEQVLAAMVGITIPPSPMPPWMDVSPENQLTALLARQMAWIEGNTSNT